jgi:NAD(P)-dependent dehydrogenase (short-subunit alcohol dehydrogenase family)
MQQWTHMTQKFDGKVVVVSGSSRGIGFAIAQAFAREGAQTVLAASSEPRLAEAVQRITMSGALPPLAVAADLRTIEGCERVYHATATRFGRCDVLANSAGATRAGDFLTQPDEEWQDGFALKFNSTVRLSRLFWPSWWPHRAWCSTSSAEPPAHRTQASWLAAQSTPQWRISARACRAWASVTA